MKKTLLLFCCCLYSLSLLSQEDAWVFFKNKPNAQYFIANPLKMLSQRAIDRRIKQSIPFDKNDAPIHQKYYNQIKNFKGITLLAKSKWLNALHIQGKKEVIQSLKQQFNFVDKIEFADKLSNSNATIKYKEKAIEKFSQTYTKFNYAKAENQIKMLKANHLHEKGYTGKGMIIAVVDAGFPNVNTMNSFKRIRTANKILGGYDFVTRSTNFYSGNSHGTHVLSTISGYIKDHFVGTAPDASFYLFRTENAPKEEPLEESLWVEAVEKADSLGVDIVNSSLGYSDYDKKSYSYTYKNMDGKTAFISRGAEIASSKGMIIVTSAGNEGNKVWRHITAPADAKGVLTVGAVKSDKSLAAFSSRGLTSDGRIKPDVMAQGQNSSVIHYITDDVVESSGTSFSSPIMAGAIACLWQSLPNKTAEEIKTIVKQYADNYTNPNGDFGYGIPDFKKAHQTLNAKNIATSSTSLKIYPNPATNVVYFENLEISSNILIFNTLGKEVGRHSPKDNKIDISYLSSGIYFLKIEGMIPIKLIKN